MKDQEIIRLDPMLTIRQAPELRRRLLDAFEQAESVEMEIDGEAAADLSFVQLIEAARLQASLAGKGFSLSSPAAGQVLETLNRAGLTTAMSPQGRAFWFHEGVM